MSYKKNIGTIGLNGFAAVLMMVRMLAYAKLLSLPAFGMLSIGLLVSSSLAIVNACGLYLLMQRDLPKLFAARRVTRGMIMLYEVAFVTVFCVLPLLAYSATDLPLAGGKGMLLMLAGVHGLSNQLFGIVSTESKSRLLQAEFSLTLFVRSCVVTLAGLAVAGYAGSAAGVLIAETVATLCIVGFAMVRAGARFGGSPAILSVLAMRHLRRLDWRMAGALLASAALAFLIQNVDRWISADLLEPHVFAQFSFAWTLLSMAATLQATVNANFFPSLAAQSYHSGARAVRARTGRTSFAFLLVLAVMAVPGYLLIRWAIASQFSQYIGVIAYVPVFLAAAAFRASDFWSNYFVIAGRTRLLFFCQVTVLVGALLIWAIGAVCFPDPMLRLSVLTLALSALSFCLGFIGTRLDSR